MKRVIEYRRFPLCQQIESQSQHHRLGAVFVCSLGVAIFSLMSPASAQENQRPLPGEEVSRPLGQRMKVWSTEGPVPVSQPPEPYQQKTVPVKELNLSVRPGQGSREYHPQEKPANEDNTKKPLGSVVKESAK